MPRVSEVLFVDLEATCWDGGGSPPGQSQEIIEIGICVVDTINLERKNKGSILIDPAESEVTDFCTGLTTLTADDLAGQCTFEEALRILVDEYDSRNKPWASWGAWDHGMFTRQCARRGQPFPFGTYHINIAAEFALNTGRTKTAGLPTAMNYLGLELEGIHHRGDDDAWNIAAIFIEMQKRIRKAM